MGALMINSSKSGTSAANAAGRIATGCRGESRDPQTLNSLSIRIRFSMNVADKTAIHS
jgi:hypothetical protein